MQCVVAEVHVVERISNWIVTDGYCRLWQEIEKDDL
jgi:hypothetical protein